MALAGSATDSVTFPGALGKRCDTVLWFVQPLAYMAVHISLTTMTFALCKLWWASYAAHTAFLLFIFAISAWNGEQSGHEPLVPHGRVCWVLQVCAAAAIML